MEQLRSIIQESIPECECRLYSPDCLWVCRRDQTVAIGQPGLFRDGPAWEKLQKLLQLGKTSLVVYLPPDGRRFLSEIRAAGASPASYIESPLQRELVAGAVNSAFEILELTQRISLGDSRSAQYESEIHELTEIAVALSSERDTRKLLQMILDKSIDITGADAGSLYVAEESAGKPVLKVKVMENHSVPFDYVEVAVPCDRKSIAGHAAVTAQPLNLPDVHDLPDSTEFSFNPEFDQKSGYRTKSVLSVPMINRDNEVIGVIQLINKKKANLKLTRPSDCEVLVIPFDPRSELLAFSLASQAAVILENVILYEEIQNLFEGFVAASITAIEARDPTTRGHSSRVCMLVVALAEAIDESDREPFEDVHFSQDDLKMIEYACMLHDFGKIAVPEKVLVKARKLHDEQRDRILGRFDYIKKSLEAEHWKNKVDLQSQVAPETFAQECSALDRQLQEHFEQIDNFLNLILKLNEPRILDEGAQVHLERLARLMYRDLQGHMRPCLEEAELECLGIPKGSLTQSERRQIEEHVVHSFDFLRQIPWSKRFKHVPEIAYTHHEKLDGSGYPRGLSASQIPIAARMMTICDIFDALTAADRPYKKAVSNQRALQILRFEAQDNRIDSDILQLFVDKKLYDL